MNFCGNCGHRLPTGSLSAFPDYANRSPREYTPPFLLEKILVNRNALEGERKHVSVFFADVTGFTTLSETLDPEDVHDFMDGCFEILGQENPRRRGHHQSIYRGTGSWRSLAPPSPMKTISTAHAMRHCAFSAG